MRVYISSTYEDLTPHRRAVIEALRGVLDVECMEDYPAADERPLAKCLKDIEGCDGFVLILGLRYGYEPPLDNPHGKSITHLEYEHAARNRKPCFVFLLDPAHPQDERWVDADARGPTSKIGRFRGEVAEKHVRALFTSPDNLATEVLRALFHHLRAEPARVSSFPWPAACDFTAYLEERREGFHGREWLFEEVRQWLNATHPRALLIKADWGVGKSAFLSQLVRANPDASVVAWHFCQHDTKETLEAATFVRSLAAQLAEALPEYRRVVEDDPAMHERLAKDASSVLEAVVLNPLRKIPVPPSHRLLVIDALDEALELDEESRRKDGTILSLLAAKASRFPSWLRILASSRKHPTVIGSLQAAFGAREIDAEDERNQKDLHGYVLARCAREEISDTLREGRSSPAAVAALLQDRSEGKFLYASRALNDLENGSISVEELTSLQPGMDAYYTGAFERRFGVDGARYPPFKALLGLMAMAREPLPPSTLAEILDRREDEINAQRGQLSDFVVARKGGFALDHFSLTEWLTRDNAEGYRRAGAWAVDRSGAEERLRTWTRTRLEAGDAHRELYLLRHAGTHLAPAERDAIFARLLFDPRWLYGRLRAAGAAALVDDCAQVRQSEAIHLLAMALRNSAHLLATEPRLLPGQLIARLGNLDVPEVRSLCRAFQETRGDWSPALLPVTASLPLSPALIATLRVEHLVTAIAVLSDGRLAVGPKHGPIRVWPPGPGSDALMLQGWQSGVNSLVALPDGGLAAGGERGSVHVWERPGEAAAVPLGPQGWSRAVRHLLLLHDGRLASASDDRSIWIWTLGTRSEPVVLRGHDGQINALVELPDRTLASAANDGTVCIWNTASGVELRVMKGHQGAVRKLLGLADGRLVSAGDDKTIRVWHPRDGAEPFLLSGHEGHVGALTALPDGRIASSSSDGRIRVWTPSPGSSPTILEGRHDLPRSGAVRALVTLQDGRLASGGDDGNVRVWDLKAADSYVLYEHGSLITTLVVLPDGRLASGAGDGSVHVFDVASRTAAPSAAGWRTGVSSLAVLPDGRIVAGADDGSVVVRDVTTGAETVLWRGREGPVDSLRVLPDGGLACASPNEVVLFRKPLGRLRPQIVRTIDDEDDGEDDKNIVGVLAVFPDGRLAAVAGNRVHVWDPGRPDVSHSFKAHEDPGPERPLARWIWALAALPDGRLATASDNTVRVWNLERGGDPVVLPHHGIVFHLAVLTDGRLVSGSGDGTVRVFDPSYRQDPILLSGHAGLVSGLAPLPGGRLASCSEDRTVRLWDVEARREIARFHADTGIGSLTAAQDGLILAGGRSGRLHSLRLVE
jgi:WD40 repeat protein